MFCRADGCTSYVSSVSWVGARRCRRTNPALETKPLTPAVELGLHAMWKARAMGLALRTLVDELIEVGGY
jgi:hypothetical protein